MKTLIVGAGEVGTSLYNVLSSHYETDMVDMEGGDHHGIEIMHICFPYFEKFIKEVERYQNIYRPKYTVVHSTVPVGTSRACNAIHSPIRGLHPNLEGGIKTFVKFLGGPEASEVADYFRKAGIKVMLCDTQEETELGKLLSTEYYRTCIEFTKRAKELADKHNVPFHTSYTLFNKTYNEGYQKLGYNEYTRPVLQPIMKQIGGHCIVPNSKLLNDA